MNEPYLAGIDLLASIGSAQDERRNRAAEIAPDFVRLAIGVTYGEIFSRPGLDLRTRVIVSIATLVASDGSPASLRTLIRSALVLELPKRDVVEAIIQTAAYGGIPRAFDALADCHDLLAEMDPACQAGCSAASETGQW